MFLFRNCWITELYVGWDGSVWSGDIAEVLVKAECRIHSDTEVFEIIGICYWLVVNDDRWWYGGCWTNIVGQLRHGKRKYIVSVLRELKASEFAESHLRIDVMAEAMMMGDSSVHLRYS